MVGGRRRRKEEVEGAGDARVFVAGAE